MLASEALGLPLRAAVLASLQFLYMSVRSLMSLFEVAPGRLHSQKPKRPSIDEVEQAADQIGEKSRPAHNIPKRLRLMMQFFDAVSHCPVSNL